LTWLQSYTLPLSYSDLNIENLSAVRHLEFDRKWIFTILWPTGSHNALAYQILTQSANARQGIDDSNSTNFCGLQFVGNIPIPTPSPEFSELSEHQLWRVYRTIIGAPKQVIIFNKVILAPFPTKSASNVTVVEKGAKCPTFLSPVKLGEMWVKYLSEPRFEV